MEISGEKEKMNKLKKDFIITTTGLVIAFLISTFIARVSSFGVSVLCALLVNIISLFVYFEALYYITKYGKIGDYDEIKSRIFLNKLFKLTVILAVVPFFLLSIVYYFTNGVKYFLGVIIIWIISFVHTNIILFFIVRKIIRSFGGKVI